MKINEPIPLKFNVKIKGDDYIRIPGNNLIISRTENYKDLNFRNTLLAIIHDDKIMPPTDVFMPYLLRVREAREGRLTLYNANNRPLPRDEVEELYKKLYFDSWTWLNNYFDKNESERLINETALIIEEKGDKILVIQKNFLESCVMEDCFVDLKFNSQGLPIKKSENQNYIINKKNICENIKFFYPRKCNVARFVAYSYRRNILDCGWGHSYKEAGHGVFDCIEGIPKK